MSYRLKFYLVLLSGFSLITSVDAGRQRYVEEDAVEVYSTQDITKEVEFGRLMAAQLLANYSLVDDESLLRYINKVGQVVLQNSPRQELNFYFGVIESTEINAYATPGGYIFITTAALEVINSEAELVAVLAHEIAHVDERHIVKALKIKAADASLTSALGSIVGSQGAATNALFDQALGKAFDILYSKGLKIDDEFEADKVAIVLTMMAGYDPSAYVAFLHRIKPLIENNQQQLASTHPSIEKRVNQLLNEYQRDDLINMGGLVNELRFTQNIQNNKEQ